MSRHRYLIGLLLVGAALWWAGDQAVRATSAGKTAGTTSTAAAKSTAKASTGGSAPEKTNATSTTNPGTGDSVLPSRSFLDPTVVLRVPAPSPQDRAAKGQATRDRAWAKKFQKAVPSDQKAAQLRARAQGMKPGVAGRNRLADTLSGASTRRRAPAASVPLPGIEGPGGIPHYFGPYGNWAFSPLPKGGVAQVTILDGGIGYTNPLIIIDDAYGTGDSFSIPTTQAGGVVQPPVLAVPVGSNISAPIATVIDDPALCGNVAQPACGTGALADAVIGGPLTGGIRKFVDTLPGLGPGGANNLNQFIPVGVPSGWPLGCVGAACTADYYEIGLVEYAEQMHSDLPATKLRGYVQIVPEGWTGTDAFGNALSAVPLTTANGLLYDVTIGGNPAFGAAKPHYLGPTLVAMGRVHGVASPAGDPKPVRIKFLNLLPTGAGGDLLLPVDETVPGAGDGVVAGEKYTQNRATIHLHGNNTVWISDGNTHQWISPANETTSYPAGVSARNVPDMAGCASDVTHPELPGTSGCMTFYYTNAQSARLQFYHDHAHGITRLNVYAGEAAGYLITDAVELDMIGGTNVSGVNPNLLKVLPGFGIPLVIQDKTWVDADTIWAQDPTWNAGSGPRDVNGNITAAVTGDFWYPHVYMTVTNPWDVTGTNGVGRWFYGPWFNPPTPVCVNGGPVGCIEIGPVPNEYYDPLNAPWEPPMRPGVPNPSIPGESFLDTPIVNGTAYPVLQVEPKAVRFRILNAANDRAQNLQLYVAADKKFPTTPGSIAVPCDGAVPVGDCTEVAMVPVGINPANQYADTPSGIPDPNMAGPDWWQIGTEGGFMPAPVVVPPQPIGYNLDPAYFNFGIVNQHSLFLMPAERADVVVDFSAYAGKTLILYNDSPAPVPAGAAPYDNYTGDGNGMDGGGAPNTQPGYGPNTRTIMQIQVGTAVTPGTETADVTLANLQAVFAKTATKRGVFEVSQDPIIVPQAAYDTAYNNTFPADASQFILNIGDTQKTFQPIDQNGVLQPAVTIPLEMKAMHDEMGGVYDTMFGRMSGMLGLTNPNSALGFILPFPFSSPPTDIVKGSLEATPIGATGRRHAAVEDLPQRRRHPSHPHAPVHRPDSQPRGAGRTGCAGSVPGRAGGRRLRCGLEGHLQGESAGNHVPRAEAHGSDAVAGAVRGARQRAADRPAVPRGGGSASARAGRLVRPERERRRSDHQRQGELRLGVRVALPHPLARRDGLHALAGVRGSADGRQRPHGNAGEHVGHPPLDRPVEEGVAVQDRTGDEPDLHLQPGDVHVEQREPHGPEDFHSDRAEQPGVLVSPHGRRAGRWRHRERRLPHHVRQLGVQHRRDPGGRLCDAGSPDQPLGSLAVGAARATRSGEPGLDGHGDDRDPLRRRALHGSGLRDLRSSPGGHPGTRRNGPHDLHGYDGRGA